MKKILIMLCVVSLIFNAFAQEIELKMVQIDTSPIANVTKANAIEMLETEVTVALYEAVMGERPVMTVRQVQAGTNEGYVNKYFVQSGEDLDDYPVIAVSAYDALYFCNKLSELKGLQPVYEVNGETDVTKWNYIPHEGYGITGSIKQLPTNGYRLPTVDEWKFAAKGGELYKFAGSDDLNEVAWWGKNSFLTYHPVAGKKPNGYGLYDMVGNVWEWCFAYASAGAVELKSKMVNVASDATGVATTPGISIFTAPAGLDIADQLGNAFDSGLGATISIGSSTSDPIIVDTTRLSNCPESYKDCGFRIVRTIK